MSRPIQLFVASVLYCLIACSTASAQAGVYTIYNCRFPDGTPAPTNEWKVAWQKPGAKYDLTCGDDGQISVSLTRSQSYPNGYWTGIELVLPDDLVIKQVQPFSRQWASGEPAGPPAWTFSSGYWGTIVKSGWTALRVCWGHNSCKGELQDWTLAFDAELRSFALGVECETRTVTACPATAVAATALVGLRLVIGDASRPTFRSLPAGSLLAAYDENPVKTLTYDVVDRGGGVRAAVLEIDGNAVQSRPFRTAGKPCTLPYGQISPCPHAASGAFQVDTRLMTAGLHQGRLLIYDASDAAPLERRFSFRVSGPPITRRGCIPTSQPIRVRFTPNPVRYGARRVKVAVAGLEQLPRTAHLVEDSRGTFSRVGIARLRRGRYVLTLPHRQSRVLLLTFPDTASRSHRCSQSARLAVRAGLRLKVTPRIVANGQTIQLRGRLLGKRNSQRLIEIQARARGGPRRWSLVRVLKTRRGGRFRMRYTFQRTHDPVTFEFRALRRAGRGHAFATGWSRAQALRVTG